MVDRNAENREFSHVTWLLKKGIGSFINGIILHEARIKTQEEEGETRVTGIISSASA